MILPGSFTRPVFACAGEVIHADSAELAADGSLFCVTPEQYDPTGRHGQDFPPRFTGKAKKAVNWGATLRNNNGDPLIPYQRDISSQVGWIIYRR